MTTETLPNSPSKQQPLDFQALGLLPRLVRTVNQLGYASPTPIQAKAIPPAIEGLDVLGSARTGTGKTAAYVLPLLQRLLDTSPSLAQASHGVKPHGRGHFGSPARVLILAPTRELAVQIGASVSAYAKGTGMRQCVIYGGVHQDSQVRGLRRGADIIIATPGRLCDLLSQGHVALEHIQILVLDEFDRMLDQGFLPDIRRVVALLPKERQTLLFSATTPKSLEPIIGKILREPVRISVSTQSSTPTEIAQSVWFLEPSQKRAALDVLLRDPAVTRAVVFTRTKRGASRVATTLSGAGIVADAIHGNKSQSARQRTLNRFRGGGMQVLVATDVAARGLDIDGISHVVNYDMPHDPESYVHRIGRTARAGSSGAAVSFCTQAERQTLTRIERLIAQTISAHPRSAALRRQRAL